MSKLIESLKASAKEFSQKQSMASEPPEKQKTSHELTQEQLADIYFSGSEKIKKSDSPLVIKVIEKPHPASTVPWIISSIAFFLLALSLFSTKRIFVDIKIIDEKNQFLSSRSEDRALPATDAASTAASLMKKKGARFGDKIPTQEFVFEGAAVLNSTQDTNALTLVNSSVATFARASFHFDPSANLSSCKIVFYAKGNRGGENLALALKDKENIQAFTKNKMFPFPDLLTTDWQKAEMPIVGSVEAFDPKNVTSFRFEFGSKDTGNKPGDTIFIKDIQILPL